MMRMIKTKFLISLWAAGMLCLMPVAGAAGDSSDAQLEQLAQNAKVDATAAKDVMPKEAETAKEKAQPRAVSAKESAKTKPGDVTEPVQWLDIPYGMQSQKQKMDIYLPAVGKAPFPVIVGFHGRNGDKSGVEMDGPRMGLSHGYAVVCVNYREPDEATFPADVMDAKAAIRYLKANASKYRLDASHIAAWGDSWGGKLAAFLGTTSSHMELEDFSIGERGQSSRVNAVVAWFPNLDDVHIDMDFKRLGMRGTLSRNDPDYGTAVYGAPIQSIPGLVGFADPTRYISPGTVPFLIEHGTSDTICPISQSEQFAEKLRHTIGSSNVFFFSLEGAGHHVKDFCNEENMKKVFDFLDKRLKVKEKKPEEKAGKK